MVIPMHRHAVGSTRTRSMPFATRCPMTSGSNNSDRAAVSGWNDSECIAEVIEQPAVKAPQVHRDLFPTGQHTGGELGKRARLVGLIAPQRPRVELPVRSQRDGVLGDAGEVSVLRDLDETSVDRLGCEHGLEELVTLQGRAAPSPEWRRGRR